MSDGFSSSDNRYHNRMDKETLLYLPHKTNDEDGTGLTRRFSRSVSLQEPLFNFKHSPESTLGWSAHSPSLSVKCDEDAWNLIYAAAGQVARMKMRMSISDSDTGFVADKNNIGVSGAPWRRSDGEQLFRQQHFCRCRCVALWPPTQVQNQRYQQNHLSQQKSVGVGGYSGGCDGGATAVKRECAGTGVFLPRDKLPETRKRQACPPANLPARMIQSSAAPPQIQPHIYEMGMSQRKAMISGGQQQQQRWRSNITVAIITTRRCFFLKSGPTDFIGEG